MFKSIEDFQKLSKDQFDAASQSATALSNGMQLLATETAEFTKKHFENSSETVQKLFGSRSIETAMQIQMDYAKSAYENIVAESNKIGSLMQTTAKDVFKPMEGIMAQVQSAVRPGASA